MSGEKKGRKKKKIPSLAMNFLQVIIRDFSKIYLKWSKHFTALTVTDFGETGSASEEMLSSFRSDVLQLPCLHC